MLASSSLRRRHIIIWLLIASPSQLVEDTNGEGNASSVQATGVQRQLQLSSVQGKASAVEAKASSPQRQPTVSGHKGEGKFGSLGVSLPVPEVINKGDAQYPPPLPANTLEDVDALFGSGPNAYAMSDNVCTSTATMFSL